MKTEDLLNHFDPGFVLVFVDVLSVSRGFPPAPQGSSLLSGESETLICP